MKTCLCSLISLDPRMSPWLFTLLLCYSSGVGNLAGGVRMVSSVGQDCVLDCAAKEEPGVWYRAVRWYKMSQEHQLIGLLTRDLPDGATHLYDSPPGRTPPVLLNASHSIRLHNVTCADSGRYTCHLAAPVGARNSDGDVLLTLTDCPESFSDAAVGDAFMAVCATLVLVFALLVFGVSYVCLKNTIKDRSRTKQRVLEAPLKPLEASDLMLIYRLGPKPQTKHVFV